jgi:hypothetical protein
MKINNLQDLLLELAVGLNAHENVIECIRLKDQGYPVFVLGSILFICIGVHPVNLFYCLVFVQIEALLQQYGGPQDSMDPDEIQGMIVLIIVLWVFSVLLVLFIRGRRNRRILGKSNYVSIIIGVSKTDESPDSKHLPVGNHGKKRLQADEASSLYYYMQRLFSSNVRGVVKWIRMSTRSVDEWRKPRVANLTQFHAHDQKTNESLFQYARQFITRRGDTLHIYFTGHGHEADPNSVNEDEKQPAWILADGLFTREMLHSELKEFRKGTRVVIFSDCCFAGQMFQKNELWNGTFWRPPDHGIKAQVAFFGSSNKNPSRARAGDFDTHMSVRLNDIIFETRQETWFNFIREFRHPTLVFEPYVLTTKSFKLYKNIK